MKSSKKAQSKRRMMPEGDMLVRQIVLDRDEYRCVRCEKTKVLQAAHILPKGHYPRLRFELLNVLTLCVGCHLFFAHKDPTGFTAWLEEKYPGRVEQLRITAATCPKLDMKLLLLCLRREVQELPLPAHANPKYQPVTDENLPF